MKEIPLVNGRGVALVDDEDYDRITAFGTWRLSVNAAKYALSKNSTLMHRLHPRRA